MGRIHAIRPTRVHHLCLACTQRIPPKLCINCLTLCPLQGKNDAVLIDVPDEAWLADFGTFLNKMAF